MGTVGRLLRNVRAGERRSPFAGSGFAAPNDITVTSTAFSDGGTMPKASAGKGVGDDVPLPRPLLHTVAVLEPGIAQVDTGALQPGTAGIRFITASLGHRGYAGPRPIPGHGPHHYRFHVFALDEPIPVVVTTAKALLKQMPGHALARGVLTGTYERP